MVCAHEPLSSRLVQGQEQQPGGCLAWRIPAASNRTGSTFGSREKRIPFGLDRESRLQGLSAAGFKDVEIELWSSSLTCDTARLVALYSTFSPIQALEPDSRREFLSNLARIADEQFGGRVERALLTVLYTGQRGSP